MSLIMNNTASNLVTTDATPNTILNFAISNNTVVRYELRYFVANTADFTKFWSGLQTVYFQRTSAGLVQTFSDPKEAFVQDETNTIGSPIPTLVLQPNISNEIEALCTGLVSTTLRWELTADIYQMS